MAAIDIGSAATIREANYIYGKTLILVDNPANLSGKITSVELYFGEGQDGVGVKVGTFYGSGTDYTCRDYANIGAVTGGSKQTFSGLNISVEAGDYIGIYYSGGKVRYDSTGYAGVYEKTGDQFNTGQQTYVLRANETDSVYGEGEEVAALGGKSANMAAKMISGKLI
ncbi:unnamed protein product [marine sediment metagenome]|uniref:Uncharacterized protein n=1 Tax=marine sediment metagenome TaxID=412755 RepID=X1BG86_9ZZZZ